MKKLLLTITIFISAYVLSYAQCTLPIVNITSPTASPMAICEGATLTLSGTATATDASQNGGFTYTWRKIVSSSTIFLTASTDITLPINTTTNVPSYTINSAAIADAGTYVLRVEDGTAGNAACYTEETIVVTVNPKPVITSAATDNICSGVAQNYSITSTISSTYSWTRAAIANINAGTESSGTGSTITETLTQSAGMTPSTVTYVITPTSTTGSCAGTPVNYVVTVNPKPSISSSATGTICSGVAQNYSITSTISSTYSWTRAITSGISNTGVTGTGSTITETLTQSAGFTSSTVTYVITPTSTTGSCAGTPFNYLVTVNPTPTITSSATGTICSGVAQNYSITSTIPSTYYWTRAVVANVNAGTLGSYTGIDPITEALTLDASATAPRAVTYVITPTSTTGSCAGTPFNYVVTVNPTPYITSSTSGTICTGTPQSYSITSNIPSTYSWTRVPVAGVFPVSGSGTTNTINETLTSGISPSTVTYIITPTSTTGSCVGNTFNYIVTISGTAVPTVTLAQTPFGAICEGTSVTFKATQTNGGNPVYTWTSSVIGLLLPTTDTYTSSNLVDGEVISVSMTSTLSCALPSTASSSVTMHVLSGSSLPTVSIASDKTAICAGNPVTFYKTATTNIIVAPSYEWFIESNGNQISQGMPSSNNSFTTSALQPNDKVFVRITSNDVCTNPIPVASNALTIVVHAPVSEGSIASDQTICYGTTPAKITEVTASNAASPSFVWESSVTSNVGAWVPVSASNNIDLVLTDTYTSDVYIRRVVTDASKPAPCNVAVTDPIHITVVPCTAFTSAITGDAQITAGQQNVAYSVPNQPGFTYAWSIAGGIIVSGQNTNAVTVNWDAPNPFARTTAFVYSISVTETNQGNQSNTTTLELTTLTTGTTKSQAQSGVKLFPNPTAGSFNIEMPESGTDVNYEILDLTGLSVASGSFTSSGNDQKIDAYLEAGMYQIILRYNNNVTCVRLSKV